MKNKNKALYIGIIAGSILLGMDQQKITPGTIQKRQELMRKWGPNLVAELTEDTENDEESKQTQNAINMLEDLDLDAHPTASISQLPDGMAIVTYNLTHSIPEKTLVIPIASRTPHHRLSDEISPIPNQKPSPIPQIPLTPPPTRSSPVPSSPRKTNIVPEKKSWFKNQSATTICVGIGISIATIAALIYFLKNTNIRFS